MPLLLFFLLIFCWWPTLSEAQTGTCPNDPPTNPWLADSPWPTYHRNNYAQASTCLRGPIATDSLLVKAKTNIRGGTSPWMYFSDNYPNGDRVLYYSNASFVYKVVDDGNSLITADSLRIDFDLIDFGWNFLLTKQKVWFTYDPKSTLSSNNTTALFKLSDADTTDAYSDIVVLDTFLFEDYGLGKVQTFALNYNGQITFNTENDPNLGYATVGIIDQQFNLVDSLHYACAANEIVHHNTMPIEENNSFYIVTTHRLLRFDWNGSQLSLAWEAAYDFVHDGPTGSFAEGSGTTPTLMGWGTGKDKLVVVVDGHAQNNLVAFWRELPAGWTGISGQSIHFADSIQLPLAVQLNNTFQSVENSPTVFGYDLAVAQFNGFLGYGCTNTKGVQKLHWDTVSNQWSVAWQNSSINMNGVLTYSEGSNMVYSSGKEADCNYYYYGLDWATGNLDFRFLLGQESGVSTNDPYYDAGNNSLIDEQGNIYFAGGKSIIKLEQIATPIAVPPRTIAPIEITLYPNPSPSSSFNIAANTPLLSITVYNSLGQTIPINWQQEQLQLLNSAKGLYWVELETKQGQIIKKIVVE